MVVVAVLHFIGSSDERDYGKWALGWKLLSRISDERTNAKLLKVAESFLHHDANALVGHLVQALESLPLHRPLIPTPSPRHLHVSHRATPLHHRHVAILLRKCAGDWAYVNECQLTKN
ncbi:hypothetical protein SAY87_022950 [Trapa incisa]|uniref:Uncharacterized protein n=1 Tax=Trapa incisa TaxID=236973 RepID=A0AAN7K4Y3_9MYRT|nr:hypothetical protein SAY87_022950 [Trapa incisa]